MQQQWGQTILVIVYSGLQWCICLVLRGGPLLGNKGEGVVTGRKDWNLKKSSCNLSAILSHHEMGNFITVVVCNND
jgi:hypothetical protein